MSTGTLKCKVHARTGYEDPRGGLEV